MRPATCSRCENPSHHGDCSQPHPPHITEAAWWADLVLTLDAHDLTGLLEQQLAKPVLGNAMFRRHRLVGRARQLRGQLALVEAEIAALTSKAAAA